MIKTVNDIIATGASSAVLDVQLEALGEKADLGGMPAVCCAVREVAIGITGPANPLVPMYSDAGVHGADGMLERIIDVLNGPCRGVP